MGGVPFLNKFRASSISLGVQPRRCWPLTPAEEKLLKPLLRLTSEERLGKCPDGGTGWLKGVTAEKDRAFWEGEGCWGCHSVKKFPLSPPPPCPQVCPCCYCDCELQQGRRPQTNGTKQCLAPFVSRLPFFSPPSQSTGLLCIDFPLSETRRPLSAVLYALFCLFCLPPPPAEPSLLLAFSALWERNTPPWLDATH